MSVIADLKNEIEAYPHEFLTLEIVEVDEPGDAINVGEDVTFRIQVTNSGELDVSDLSLLVEGRHGAQVRDQGAASQFGDDFTASPLSFAHIPAHRPNSPVVSGGSKYTFKAPAGPTPETELVRVSVASWDTDLSHLLIDHSDPDTLAKTVFSSEVIDN